MKRIIQPLLLLALLMPTSCYEDKGNYEYSTLTEVEIKGIEPEYTVYVGGMMQIPVEVSYKNGTLTDVSYEWRVDGNVVSTEKDLNIPVNFAVKPGLYADFSVIDNQTGIKTLVKFRVNVSTEFYNGWLLLSDEGDHSELTYIRNDGRVYPNIYKQLNNEDLGPGALQIKEHWTPWGEATGEVFVAITKGPNYAVELDGNSLYRVLYSKDEFLGGTPDDFKPQSMDCVAN